MLPKYRKREYIYDKLHRGFVNVCILATLVTGAMCGYAVYDYFRYVRPVRRALREKAEEELLAEGRHIDDVAVELQ